MRRLVLISVSSSLLVVGLSAGFYAYKTRSSGGGSSSQTPAGSVAFNSDSSEQLSKPISLDPSTSNAGPSPTPDTGGLKVTTNSGNTSAGQAMVGGGNSSDSSSPAPAVYREPTLSELASYAQYKDGQQALFGELIIGTGSVAVMNKRVAVYYKGWLTDGTVFDQSKVGTPFVFAPGEHKVIAGWESDILGMKVGGKRRFIIPSVVGYGSQATGKIPANSLLIFDVELLEVEK